MNETYEETVDCERIVSAMAGPGHEMITLTESLASGGILAEFAKDIDIQEITVVSTNIGFVRRYRKRMKNASE